ncbi:hypothetical protein BH23ACT10_BH23ACT10_27590 [soil metagenome]
MPRADKVAAVSDVSQRLNDATATVLTEYRGLSVDDLAELREKLRATDATYRVVKNTLTRLAAKDAGVDIPDEYLVGPTAVTFCAGDPVAVAKVLRTFSKQHPQLVIKGGVLDGRMLDASETSRLADLESREELLARFAGIMDALIAQPARLAQASLSKFARLLAALQDRKAAEPQDVAAAVEVEAEAADTDAAEAPEADAAAAAENADAAAEVPDDDDDGEATAADDDVTSDD